MLKAHNYIFLLFILSLACLSFTYSSGTLSEEEVYMFKERTIFEYDITYKYSPDSIRTFKRYYKVGDVEESDGTQRAKISYYKLSPEEKEQVFCIFEVERKNNKTTIDALHLACVYRNDTVTFGLERIPLVYEDTMSPGKKFPDRFRSTSLDYFTLHNSVRSPQEKTKEEKKKKSSSEGKTWMETRISNRICKGQQRVAVPYDTLDAAFMYFDIERIRISNPNPREAGPGGPERTREVIYSIHIREWYTPQYGVVKREIEDTQANLVIKMELSEIYVLKQD